MTRTKNGKTGFTVSNRFFGAFLMIWLFVFVAAILSSVIFIIIYTPVVIPTTSTTTTTSTSTSTTTTLDCETFTCETLTTSGHDPTLTAGSYQAVGYDDGFGTYYAKIYNGTDWNTYVVGNGTIGVIRYINSTYVVALIHNDDVLYYTFNDTDWNGITVYTLNNLKPDMVSWFDRPAIITGKDSTFAFTYYNGTQWVQETFPHGITISYYALTIFENVPHMCITTGDLYHATRLENTTWIINQIDIGADFGTYSGQCDITDVNGTLILVVGHLIVPYNLNIFVYTEEVWVKTQITTTEVAGFTAIANINNHSYVVYSDTFTAGPLLLSHEENWVWQNLTVVTGNAGPMEIQEINNQVAIVVNTGPSTDVVKYCTNNIFCV